MSSLAQLLGRTPLSIQNIAGATAPYKQHTDMTIAPVNTATSAIFMSAFATYQLGVAAALVGADKVRVSIYAVYPDNIRSPFSLSVVDFGAMVRSVQRGTLGAGPEGNVALPLATINASRAIAIVSPVQNHQQDAASALTHTLTNTSLTINRQMNCWYYWQVLEFH